MMAGRLSPWQAPVTRTKSGTLPIHDDHVHLTKSYVTHLVMALIYSLPVPVLNALQKSR